MNSIKIPFRLLSSTLTLLVKLKQTCSPRTVSLHQTTTPAYSSVHLINTCTHWIYLEARKLIPKTALAEWVSEWVWERVRESEREWERVRERERERELCKKKKWRSSASPSPPSIYPTLPSWPQICHTSKQVLPLLLNRLVVTRCCPQPFQLKMFHSPLPNSPCFKFILQLPLGKL